MGYNDESASSVILDLETAPIDDAAGYLEPSTAPAHYKDAEKIDRYIKEKTAAKVDRAALDVDLCRIAAVGIWREHAGGLDVLTAENEAQESDVLRLTWEAISPLRLIGFNVMAFDLPVLLRRSMYLGVHAPFYQMSRYRQNAQVVDLYTELTFHGLVDGHSLDFYCKRLGITVDTEDVKGAEMPARVAAGDWPAVIQHCRADVVRTALLAHRLGHFRYVDYREYQVA